MSSHSSSASLGLLVLRLALGGLMLAHGLQKLLVWGVAGTQGSFAEMGVPMADIAAIGVIAVEVVGGVLIALGLGTRVVGVLIAIDMLVALFLVHLSAGPFASEGGYELVLAFAAIGVALSLTGAGRYSGDAMIAARRS
ncbi:MAG: DoxX family protein [Mycetocola sp.]